MRLTSDTPIPAGPPRRASRATPLVLTLPGLLAAFFSLALATRADAAESNPLSARLGSVTPLAEPTAPTVVTGKTSALTQTTATLNGWVIPNGDNVTECKFEYGTSVPEGTTAPCTPPLPGAGTSEVPVSA